MSILNIQNRTENWCTASVLSPLIEQPSARTLLASHLVGSSEHCSDSVEFELFWKGMRDYVHEHRGYKQNRGDYENRFLECFRRRFPSLRREVEDIGRFRSLKCHNYVADENSKGKLYDNLCNTEVDIVLQTRQHLCIGEARSEAAFGGDSKHILVHQLIRQYVMATILVELTGGGKTVVPFVVGDCREDLMRKQQVKFMIECGYLRESNVLSWTDLSEIPKGEVAKRFKALAERWVSETAHHSMMSNIVMHRSYQEIIGLGRDALRPILRELSIERNHWFWALRAISGEDPVPAADIGRFDEIRRAWLQWGRNRGLVDWEE